MPSAKRSSLPIARLVIAGVALALVVSAPLRQGVLGLVVFPLTVAQGIVGVVLNLPRLPGLAHENAALRQELLQRQLELNQAREALRQAAAVQVLIAASPSQRGTVATVISRSLLPTQHTILLNKGERDGLSKDSPIVDAAGVIGRVVELSPRTALVLLLTDPESRAAALVERSRETGLLVGRGRGECELIYLAVDADVQEGDRIMTAGLGGVFAKGLLLGTVARVTRDEQRGAASAWVRPSARLTRAEEVLCLPPAR